MSNENTINDGLLVKYLMNEADAAETNQIELWLQERSEHQKYLAQLKLIWEESLSLTEGNQEEQEAAAWHKLETRLQFTEQGNPGVQRFKHRWFSIAATVVLISGLAWFGLQYYSSTRLITLKSNAKVMNQLLPDGSEITLNKNSEITYPGAFKGKTRAVSLQGEAFFKVTADAAKPFVIKVNDVTVMVVGTSFNVKGRNNTTVVVVETGIVQVSKAHRSVELHPGERTIANAQQDKLSVENTQSRLYNYYLTNELICDHTPLQELVDVLNETQQANISILTPALKKKEITVNFKNQSITEILEVIKGTFKIQVEYKNQQIILK